MGKRPDTWMPFYVGDYLRDTSRLSTEGHGAYLLLIFDYWVAGKPLPDDNQQLAAIAKLPLARWKLLRATIAQFFQIEDGLWRHKRVDAELDRAVAAHGQRISAAQASVQARRERAFNGRSTSVEADVDTSVEADVDTSVEADVDTPVAPLSSSPLQPPNNYPPSHPQPPVSSQSSETNARAARSRLSEFEEWWVGYPHKIGKRDAEIKFKIARKSATFEQLCQGVKRYVVSKPADHPWCNPATWLHQRRWEDQPAYVAKTDAPSGPDRVTEFWEGYPDPGRVSRDLEWANRLYGWASRPNGFWAQQWGPRPGHPDCQAPRQMVEWAVRRARHNNTDDEAA